jgi:hypothetical protein
MKRGPRIAIAIVAVIAAAIAGQWYFAITRDMPPEAGEPAAPPPPPAPAAPAPAPAIAAAPAAAASEGDGLRRVPIPPVDARAPAWISMAQARESGDERTPPIEHSSEGRHPDAGMLADHEAYAAYQLAQKQRLAAAYAKAATPELINLRADLERGREAGVPPEQLARVAEKIRRIEQQRQTAEATLSK